MRGLIRLLLLGITIVGAGLVAVAPPASKPDVQQFAAATTALMRGHVALPPCRAGNCRYGRRRGGLCSRHDYAWRDAGQPDLDAWVATLSEPAAPVLQAACLVSYCDLWAQGNAPLCVSHARRWFRLGKPDLDE